MTKLHPRMLKIRNGRVVLSTSVRMLIAKAVLEEGQKVKDVARAINIPESRVKRIVKFYL